MTGYKKYCERSVNKEHYPLLWRSFGIIASASALCLLLWWLGSMDDSDDSMVAVWMILRIFFAVMGVSVLVLWIRAFVGFRAKHKSMLARDAQLQTGLMGREQLSEAFAQINRDITNNGRRFGPLYIGDEWILGDGRAIRRSNVRAYFLYRAKTGKGPGHQALYIVDQDGREQTFAHAQAPKGYAGLEELYPQLPHGDTVEALNNFRNRARAQQEAAMRQQTAPPQNPAQAGAPAPWRPSSGV